ncbi:MAG: YbaK/EbsC family protein [Acidimicrobiia bacterium]
MLGERVRALLMEHGVHYDVHAHRTAYTTAETAEAEHVPGGQVAKVVMVMADDELVMAVIPGDRRLDLDKLRDVLNAGTVRLATEDEFAPSFPDCEKGAEPPFGAIYELPMVVDEGLQSEQITFNAGSHDEAITIARTDYMELTKARVAALTTRH